ncbi:MAG: hypothetical protein ACO1OB_30435 [Archangium sp.]
MLLRVGCWGLVEYSFAQGDASSYRASALTLLNHGVYSLSGAAPFEPTAYRPPGYPAFLASIAAVSRSTRAVQVVQLVLSLASGVLLAFIAERLRAGSGRWVLWLSMLSPFEAVYSGAGLSECLTTAMTIAIIAALVLLEGTRRLVVVGLLSGLLCLVRDIYIALLPFAAAAYCVFGARREFMARVRASVMVGVCTALVIAPWTIRNAVHFHKLIPISAGRLGYSLWMGTWAVNGDFTQSDATGRVYPDIAFLTEADRHAVLTEGEDPAVSEALFKRLFNERLRAEPVQVFGRWLFRWPRLWFGTRFDIFDLNASLLPYGSLQWKAVKSALFGINALLVVGAFIGAVLAWRKRSPLLWAVVPLAFTALIYLPLNSFENRYSQPMFPFILLLVGFAAVEAVTWWRARRNGTAS